MEHVQLLTVSIQDLSPSVGVLRLYGNSLKKALETIYEGLQHQQRVFNKGDV